MKNCFKSAIMAAAVIAITGLTGCNSGDGPAPGEEQAAILNIKLINPALTRVAGTASTSENTITDVNIFVLDAAGDVGWSMWVPNAGSLPNKTVAIQVTTAAKSVYAIANAGEDLSETFDNRGELESTGPMAELGDQYTALCATGTADGSSWTFQAPDSNGNGFLEQNVDLELKFIAARIAVSVYNNMNDYDGSSANSVRLTEVAVLNARGESRLFPGNGTSLIPTSSSAQDKKFIEGLANPTAPATPFAYFPASSDYTVEAPDVNRLNSPYTFTNASTPSNSYFYVFENDANTMNAFPTIVTLVGTDVYDNPVYFPVHLASYETWATNNDGYTGGVERGKSYNITINLNGNAKVGTGGGAPDPTRNVQNVELMVKVEIANWTPVALGKNF